MLAAHFATARAPSCHTIKVYDNLPQAIYISNDRIIPRVDNMKFYNRERELEVLQRAADDESPGMIVISGRRRVGKSRLVDEFLKKNRGLKVIVVPKEEKQAAADFAEALSDGYKPRFESVKEALEYFFTNSKERILYIDEFPNFLEVNPSIPYELQKIWETQKTKTNKILILSGSYVSMMDRIFTKQHAPLFNRATHKILLEPLQPKVVWAMQKDMGITDPAQQITNYCVLGGIPYYYEILEKNDPRATPVENLFFGVGQLREEGQDILRQEFGSAYKKYFSILEAIGNGLVSGSEIADKMGIRQTTLSKYLQSLQNDFKLIRRITPFGQNPYRSKKGLYIITDNLLAFWFTFAYGNAHAPTKDEITAFVGKRFEPLCREYLADLLQKRGERVIKTGKWWGPVKTNEGYEQRDIDVIIETDKALYLGESKWTNNKIGEHEMKRLKENATGLPQSKKPVKWVLFSKNGFNTPPPTDALLIDAETITKW